MSQLSLFPVLPAPPHRIELTPDFISEAEEKEFLRHFQSVPWEEVRMHGVIAKRRVAHFGLDYAFTRRAVKKERPIPVWLESLTERAAPLIGKTRSDIREILVTFYPEGAGIGWHKDAEVFGDAVVGVSFLSDCTMKFRNPETKEVYKLFIPRRSAYVFADEARWSWHHTIASHASDRYSITFRTLAKKQA